MHLPKPGNAMQGSVRKPIRMSENRQRQGADLDRDFYSDDP